MFLFIDHIYVYPNLLTSIYVCIAVSGNIKKTNCFTHADIARHFLLFYVFLVLFVQ